MNARADISPLVGSNVTETLLQYKEPIERALRVAQNAHSFDHIVYGVLGGRYHFYPISARTCIIMEVRRNSNWSAYHVFIAGGDLQEIRDAEPLIMENGHKLGCAKITASGRKGFARVSAQHGWKVAHVTIYKDLPPSAAGGS
jgi:hypothetical protein